jgi:hypothetical protein
MSLRAFFLRHRTKQSNLNEITSKEYLCKIPRKGNAIVLTRKYTLLGRMLTSSRRFTYDPKSPPLLNRREGSGVS